jgi:hypothetical protein
MWLLEVDQLGFMATSGDPDTTSRILTRFSIYVLPTWTVKSQESAEGRAASSCSCSDVLDWLIADIVSLADVKGYIVFSG